MVRFLLRTKKIRVDSDKLNIYIVCASNCTIKRHDTNERIRNRTQIIHVTSVALMKLNVQNPKTIGTLLRSMCYLKPLRSKPANCYTSRKSKTVSFPRYSKGGLLCLWFPGLQKSRHSVDQQNGFVVVLGSFEDRRFQRRFERRVY